MKIGVIGFGAAAIGFIERIKDSDHEIHILEKSKDIYSSSISGIRADGKLFVSNQMGGELDLDLDLQKRLVEFYIDQTSERSYESGSSFGDKEYYKNFYREGFQPILSDFYHLGTDQLKEVLFNLYQKYLKYKNIHFHFEHRISNVEIRNDQVILNNSETYDMVIVAVGRSGHDLIRSILARFPELILDNTKVDLGIRLELPNHIVEDLNREMYEFKVKYKSVTGYMVRTFCNNPSGYVVTEKYDDFVTVNGHSKLRQKSGNTNVAVLTTIQLTQPFNDPISYGTYIAKLTNILAGQDKVILQTYANFKNSKRTKNLYRVEPTLASENYITGDINLAYPRRIVSSIIDFIENLNKVIPGIANDDNLVYAPEVKFYSNRLCNQKLAKLKFAGDCSGNTRSIIYATAHGWITAEKILNPQDE
ncbi:MAG: NAD(P)/FAD-dependent oxidoreductase [Candidatus Cloacimonetes bacterium]|nr:NAD(P)/FAD-dependent oxidoreductase [Candidatus Cloacimonadota bacterium]